MTYSVAIFVAVLITFVGCAHSENSPNWRECVVGIPKYFKGVNPKQWIWEPSNPCGFRTIAPSEMTTLAGKRSAWVFFGDSTGLRSFSYVEREVLNVSAEIVKVMERPDTINHEFGSPNSNVHGNVTFRRLLYLSTYKMIADYIDDDDVFDKHDAVVMYFTVGNHDLNWKLHLKKPMPGLNGPTQDFLTAKKYWVKYSDLAVRALREAIQRRNARNPGKLFIMYREQFNPNCNAGRYNPARKGYRDCRGTILKAVQWYRKIIQPLLWELNIPVMTTDFLFADNYRACEIGDGIHLNTPCKAVEMQVIWNIVSLMKRRCVVHGMPVGAEFSNLTNLQNQGKFSSEVLPESVQKMSTGGGCDPSLYPGLDSKGMDSVPLPKKTSSPERPGLSPDAPQSSVQVTPPAPSKDAPLTSTLPSSVLYTEYVELLGCFVFLFVFGWWAHTAMS